MDILAELVGRSAAMEILRGQVQRLLQLPPRRLPPVLLLGETGTGKGLLAQLLHRSGPRAAGPFVDVNCAAIPEALLEAELFGFERGAFTDARHPKPGLFQAAHRGTLFLDEVGLLPDRLQAKLLTTIESRQVRRLGSIRSEQVDVSILAATSEDLASAMSTKQFRPDLYHRLATLVLRLPPLRARGADIQELAEHFLTRSAADHGLPSKTLAADARTVLLSYAWPGNVRELANVLERVTLLEDARVITATMLALPAAPCVNLPTDEVARSEFSMDDIRRKEREELIDALTTSRGNISRAAARLGIPRNTLRYRMAKQGLGLRDPAARTGQPTPSSVREGLPDERWTQRRIAFLLAIFLPAADEAVLSDLGHEFDIAVQKVEAFGGHVEELGPTAVLATFGLEPIEDAARRAVLAALAIQKAADRAPANGRTLLGVKLAVHSGDALVAQGPYGWEINAETLRAGKDVVEFLVRWLEPNAIWATETARPLLERWFELVPVGVPEVRVGATYRVLGRERTGFGIGGRPLTPFVGRGPELTIVRDCAAKVEGGRGQAVGVIGAPGVGKSRFVYELIRSEHLAGWRVIGGSCVSHGKTRAYLPIIDLLRAYLGIQERDDHQRVLEKVKAALMALGLSLEEYLASLLALLDVPLDDARWRQLEPAGRRARTLEGIRHLLLRAASVEKLLVVVEDLHWADSETQAVLDGVLESIPAARLLLLVTYRPEYHTIWTPRTHFTEVQVDPLSSENSDQMLSSLLGEHSSLASLRVGLIERTGGTPFFLEETVASLIEAHVVEGERGSYRVVRPEGSLGVPKTVQDVLTARLDRLPPYDKDLLQIASVVGMDVPFEVLRAIAEHPDSRLLPALARLQAAEFLYETPPSPRLEYTFKHVLTREVAYAGLPEERRRAMHRRILQALESDYADHAAEHAAELATHAVRGEVWSSAANHLDRMGVAAWQRAANHEAMDAFTEAIRVLDRLPDDRDVLERRIDVRIHLRDALLGLGQFEPLLERLREAEALAQRLGDDRRGAWVACWLCHYFWNAGDLGRAITEGRRALDAALRFGDVPLEVETSLYLGIVHLAQGRYSVAVEILERGVGLVDTVDAGPRAERLRWRMHPLLSAYLARSLAELGAFGVAEAWAKVGLERAEKAAFHFGAVAAAFALGTVALRQGWPEAAVPPLEAARAHCEKPGLRNWVPSVHASLGLAYMELGRVREGVALVETAVDRASAMQMVASFALWLSYLGHVYLSAGRLDEARDRAREALELARQQGERGHEAWALKLLGDVEAHTSAEDAAMHAYGASLAIAVELGMRPLIARCHHALGRLAGTRGDLAAARAETAEAAALACTLGLHLS